MIDAVCEDGEFHEPRIGCGDAGKRPVQLVEMVLETLALAGEIGEPRGQHAQRRALAIGRIGKRVDIKRAQEVGVIGNRASVVLEKEQDEVRVHSAELAALEPEPERTRVIAPHAEMLGSPLAELGVVGALAFRLLSEEIEEQMVEAIRIAVQAHQKRVRARKAAHHLDGIVAPGQKAREFPVELVSDARRQAERAQVVVPRAPYLLGEIVFEHAPVLKGGSRPGFRERRNPDGPPLGCGVELVHLAGRGKPAERIVVLPDLVFREGELRGAEHGRRGLRIGLAPCIGRRRARQEQHRERTRKQTEHGGQRLDDLAVLDEMEVVEHDRAAALRPLHRLDQAHRVLDG